MDSLFYAAALNLSAHFSIVQYRMGERKSFQNHKGNLSAEFRTTIKYHIRIVGMCSELASVYRPIVFTQLMISSLQICVIAYQLTLVSKSVER